MEQIYSVLFVFVTLKHRQAILENYWLQQECVLSEKNMFLLFGWKFKYIETGLSFYLICFELSVYGQ